MNKIGERVKIKREHKSISLVELAQRVGISKSCLSQIEHGRAFPSIVTLKKIADKLGSTIGELVGENDRLKFNPLVKSNERKFVKQNNNGASLYLLSHHDANKQMETYFVQFEENADTTDLIDNVAGQTFCYVINGQISINLNGDEHIMNKGDCLYYNLQDSNYIKNFNKGSSKIIWVINHSLI